MSLFTDTRYRRLDNASIGKTKFKQWDTTNQRTLDLLPVAVLDPCLNALRIRDSPLGFGVIVTSWEVTCWRCPLGKFRIASFSTRCPT